MATVEVDLGILIDGFRGLVWLQQHGEEIGMGGQCQPCNRFAAALLRGRPATEVMEMRCPASLAMQAQVDDAIEVIRERTGSGV